jgi:hypothetical protein
MESTASPLSRARATRHAWIASLSAVALALAVCFEVTGPVNPPKCPGIDPELCDPAPA